MTTARDRIIALGAIAVLILLTVVVIGLVQDAEDAGIDANEDAHDKIVRVLGQSLDARVTSSYGSLNGLYGVPGKFSMVPGDPGDAAALAPLGSTGDTGAILVDLSGTIVNGSLLRDPSVVGQRLKRPGFELALRGEPTLLPAAPGLTIAETTGAITTPVRDATGRLVGAHLFEYVISPDSPFNQEISQLEVGETGAFNFIDRRGVVVASTDDAAIGRAFDAPSDLEDGVSRRSGRIYVTTGVPSANQRVVFTQELDEFQGGLTGPLRWASLVVLAIVGLAGAVGVFTLLRRLRAAREEQRRLAQMATAREEFTSIVSHELRTPVAGLVGFLQTTIDHWPEMPEDDRRRAVERAFQNAQRLRHLTADVLHTAGIEAGTVIYRQEALDLGQLVGDAVQTALDANPERQFALTLPDQQLIVQGDVTRLRQVVTNLLENAVNSSPTDTPIEVTVRGGGNRARVSVRDHGAGIDPDERERIFEKYTRGRSGVAKGSGLGLYLARQIATAHGGTLVVDDVDGPGASVTLELPAAVQVTDAR